MSLGRSRAILNLPGHLPSSLTLAEGDLVGFLWRECRSAIEATVYPDGSYEPHGTAARDATQVWDVRDPGLTFSSVDDFTLYCSEGLSTPARVRLRMCRWSARPLHFRIARKSGQFALQPAGTDAEPPMRAAALGQLPPQLVLRSA